MRRKNLISSALITAFIVTSVSEISANAEELSGSPKYTDTQITIVDEDDSVDPLEPTDPDQSHLTLEYVPANYNFNAKLKNGTYELSSNLDGESIDVFNDRISREWSVKASVVDNSLELVDNESQVFGVTSFKINNIELIGTGADGIIAVSEENKTGENNTGLIQTAVESVSINFEDTDTILKVGDALSGSILYQLYNTPNAE